MIKILLSIILLLSFISPSFALDDGNKLLAMLSGGVIARRNVETCQYDLCETFEADEYDNSTCGTAPCTTEVGSPDGDDTNMTGRIGSRNLALDHTEELELWHTAANLTSVWYLFKWEYNNALESDEAFFRCRTGADGTCGYLHAVTDGSFKVVADGGGNATTATSVHSAGTAIWLKVRCKEGTGANAEISAWYYSSGWSSPVNVTNGTRTGDLEYMKLSNSQDEAAEDHYADNVMIEVDASDPFTGDPSTY